MDQGTTHVALDDSKRKLAVAILRPGQTESEQREMAKEPHLIQRLFRRLAREGAVPACYEAGVSGYDLYRQITACGVTCQVIAPALTPRRPGQRIKTDRRDAAKLAMLAAGRAYLRVAPQWWPCRPWGFSPRCWRSTSSGTRSGASWIAGPSPPCEDPRRATQSNDDEPEGRGAMKTKHRWTSPVAMGVAILLGVGILVARDPVGAQPEELVVTVFGGLMINDTTGTARPSRPSSAHRRPYRDCMAVTA